MPQQSGRSIERVANSQVARVHPDRHRRIGNDRPLALTHNLGGYPGEMVSFVSIVGREPS